MKHAVERRLANRIYIGLLSTSPYDGHFCLGVWTRSSLKRSVSLNLCSYGDHHNFILGLHRLCKPFGNMAPPPIFPELNDIFVCFTDVSWWRSTLTLIYYMDRIRGEIDTLTSHFLQTAVYILFGVLYSFAVILTTYSSFASGYTIFILVWEIKWS